MSGLSSPARRYGRKKAASAAGHVGTIGENFVESVFLELQWGPVPVGKHDAGTDFFVQVRDRELTELGLLLGVQVKSETEYFGARVEARAKARGFWEYKARQVDVEYWLDHVIPHVLVIFDRGSKSAYWGHVTLDAVRWTSRGARVRIPTENRLDQSSGERLLSVAAEGRRSVSWSPSSWAGLMSTPPPRRLRTALLAPRVALAGHAKPQEHELPEAALARLLLGRFPGRAGRREFLAAHRESGEDGFATHLYLALWSYLSTGRLHEILDLSDRSMEPFERVALLAIQASIAVENGDPSSALTSLEGLELGDAVDPVDLAWIDAHRSRCLMEMGDLNGARELALAVAATGLLHAHDHSAVALRAAVLNTALLAHDSSLDVQLVLAATDSPPVWWRDQHRALALSNVLDDSFSKRIGDAHGRAGTSVDAWDRLRGVALGAGVSADHRAWSVAMSELVRYELSLDPPR